MMNRRRFLLLATAASLGLTATAAWARDQVRVGMTLQSGTGQWTGNPTSYTYAWQHRPPGGTYTTIQDGATNRYQVSATDVGRVIRVMVTAYNPAQSLPAASPATSAVRA